MGLEPTNDKKLMVGLEPTMEIPLYKNGAVAAVPHQQNQLLNLGDTSLIHEFIIVKKRTKILEIRRF